MAAAAAAAIEDLLAIAARLPEGPQFDDVRAALSRAINTAVPPEVDDGSREMIRKYREAADEPIGVTERDSVHTQQRMDALPRVEELLLDEAGKALFLRWKEGGGACSARAQCSARARYNACDVDIKVIEYGSRYHQRIVRSVYMQWIMSSLCKKVVPIFAVDFNERSAFVITGRVFCKLEDAFERDAPSIPGCTDDERTNMLVFARQAFLALAEFHALGIVHGEIRPDIVVLVFLPSGDVEVALNLPPGRTDTDTFARKPQGDLLIDVEFEPPEVQQDRSNNRTQAADVYSLARVLSRLPDVVVRDIVRNGLCAKADRRPSAAGLAAMLQEELQR